MEKTVQDRVLAALNELKSGSLKSFRNKLSDREFTVKDGYNKIPQGKLENKDPEDLTKLILQYYGDSYGVELTVSVLKAIDENQVAAGLEQRLVNGSGRSNIGGVLLAGSPGENRGERKPMQPPQIDSSTSCSGPPKEHFVDEHREALISGVPLVEPILDSLMSAKLLQEEDYETILKQGTSYAQMRRLYNKYVKSWEDPQKDIFKDALKRMNRILVENLEK